MENKQMEMAPMPNQDLSDTQMEGGGGTPVYMTVPNDIACCWKAPCKINSQKEFKGWPGVTCDHAGCNNQAFSYCNGDIKFMAIGPRLHAGCGKNLCQTHMKWIQYSDGLHECTSCSDGCADEAHKAVWLWNRCLAGCIWPCMCTCGWGSSKKKKMFANGAVVERD